MLQISKSFLKKIGYEIESGDIKSCHETNLIKIDKNLKLRTDPFFNTGVLLGVWFTTYWSSSLGYGPD